ncbi:MAG: glutamate--tRNA ligase [Clostridia bacterium]|nr:glutamate--tRNA ligase [Clostridia bacterium]
MDYNALAELLYPNIKTLPADMEARYPERDLPEGAKVTRLAPSPTGFLHIGNLYGAFTDERLAHTSGGVFYLRIEDTDAKRTVPNGVELIIDTLAKLGVNFDEGAVSGGDNGIYGPYRQSERAEIYQTYAKQLIREGKAYPCFCTEEELAAIRARQEEQKLTPGYYGEFAVWRDAPMEKIKEKLDAGEKFVLRFRSEGNSANKYKFKDQIKGDIDVTENDIDHVILKSDGIPTYHFAHAVDDHLMRTTHVVRDESWLSTLPFHLQLFKALGFKLPKYCHTAQVLKLDENGNKRKVSKRKDPDFALTYYHEQGYPVSAVKEYLLTILNSNFEEWRRANPDAPLENFMFTTNKMSVSGAIFDLNKLNDISKNVISRMTAEDVYGNTLAWAKDNDPEFAAILEADKEKAIRIFSIGRGGKKPRKDFAKWNEVKDFISFFYPELFARVDVIPDNFAAGDVKKVLSDFAQSYDPADEQDAWFGKIKEISEKNGFCPDMKQYKADPTGFKGSVADVSMFIRVAVTGRMNSPDLYEVMNILGKDTVLERLARS